MSKSGKGSAFEREICVRLSEWWSDGKYGDLFWRTSGSGARATTRAKKGKRTVGHYGDILATNEEGKPLMELFTVECKKGYNAHTFGHILDCPKDGAIPKYLEWFAKAERTKVEAKTYSWWLIVKRDRREPLIFMPYKALKELYGDLETPYPCVLLDCIIEKKWKKIAGTHLSVFLDEIGSSVVWQFYNDWRESNGHTKTENR